MNVHYRIYKSPPSVRVLSHIDPVHAFQPIYRRSILMFSSYLRLGFPRGLFRISTDIRRKRLRVSVYFPVFMYNAHTSPLSDSITCEGSKLSYLYLLSLGIFSEATDGTMCPGVYSASKNEYKENSWE
jgi:hypothetical protein